ncbi:hypothetical protein [Streptomyces sp. NPDC005209]|uniref:hypothetical protein n=1 Tax=Streptomyces sp. NPDC005209 TaxID=3156715 RepID=UPI00339EB366
MWPGEQPPAGGTHPQQNPYQQPGYQQPNPYLGAPQPAPWGTPPQPPAPGPGDGGRRTRLVAIVTAACVVVAAGVTGFLVLGGGKDDKTGPATPSRSTSGSPSDSADSADSSDSASDNPRSEDDALKPTVKGWKVVVNPDIGVAFDVPPDWSPRSKSWVTYVTDDAGSDDDILIAMKAPAVFKEKWCSSDDNKDGGSENTSLANVGTRGIAAGRSSQQVARQDSAEWVYGWYTQPDRKKVTTGPVTSFTTASGIEGSVAGSQSSGVARKKKCDSDGKATTFAFKNAAGRPLSWSFVGAKGVKGEVPDTTIRAILRTVRLYDTGSDS